MLWITSECKVIHLETRSATTLAEWVAEPQKAVTEKDLGRM